MAVGEIPEIDVPTAKELIDEVHRHVGTAELTALVAGLQAKADRFAAVLGPDAIEALDGPALDGVLSLTFVARRRSAAALGARTDSQLRAWVGDLLYGPAPLDERFDRFCGDLELPRARGEAANAELASELLHFTAPERHALWTRWIWSPESRTGALPLVIGEDFDLEDTDDAGSHGATYERIARAIAAIDASPEAASFRPQGGGRLGTDVFLVTVYGVYMHTVLGLKMTQEFNTIVPPIPELARRLLGIHRVETN